MVQLNDSDLKSVGTACLDELFLVHDVELHGNRGKKERRGGA